MPDVLNIGLGDLHWRLRAGRYAQNNLEGILILTSSTSHEYTRVFVEISPVSTCTVLSYGPRYIARVAPQELIQVRFVLSSLDDTFSVRIMLQLSTDALGEYTQEHILSIPGSSPTSISEHTLFISYHSGDLQNIRGLVAQMKSLPLKIWVAQLDLEPTDWFPNEITAALSRSTLFVLFLSEGSTKSSWVRGECDLALGLLAARSLKLIVPIVIDGCDTPDGLNPYDPIPYTPSSGAGGEVVLQRINTWIRATDAKHAKIVQLANSGMNCPLEYLALFQPPL